MRSLATLLQIAPLAVMRAAAFAAVLMLVASGGAHELIHADERSAPGEAVAHASEDDLARVSTHAPRSDDRALGYDCALHTAAHAPLAAPTGCALSAPVVRSITWPHRLSADSPGLSIQPAARPPRI